MSTASGNQPSHSGGGADQHAKTRADDAGPISHDSPTIPSGAPERFAGAILTPEPEDAEQFGPYKVLRKLGEGGFGVVYACEQREPIRRIVALKVIKLGMDTREVIARFEAERQALAVMEHPNVAKVLDAGVTPRGRPFFVMEYVAGQPITDYCDQTQLSMRDRLALFIMVCQAVQHAHQKGIIHRDLKPSNVLVTLVDGKPVPKVIDFGIAKATGQHLTGRTMFTEAGRLIGTPEYMSPEQAGLSPLDVDTRTDVYALGVLLYELLTGVLPHEPKKLRSAAMTEIQRIIREVEPPKPSTRLGQLDDGAAPTPEDRPAPAGTAEMIAKRRRMDVGQLLRELKGDLDWITMKAMEKDRSRRYETAAALAADIEHYLRNEPVTAGPPSATYRMRKFARRHRAGVATGAVFVLLIAGGMVALSAAYGMAETERGKAVDALKVAEDAKTRADRERRAALDAQATAEAERTRAEDEAARADREKQVALDAKTLAEQEKARADAAAARALAALQFVAGMFESIDPAKALGREISVREILDATDEKLRGNAETTPDVEAAVREVMGTAYHRLSINDRAEANLTRALEIREKEEGPDGENTLQNLHNLGASYASQGRFDDAEKALARAIEGRQRVYGAEHKDTLASKSLMVYVQQVLGHVAEAERAVREIIEAQTRVLGAGDRDTIDSGCSLADILQSQGKYDEADAWTKTLVETSVKSLGSDDPLTLQAMSIRGSLLNAMGNFAESEKILRTVYDIKKRVFGEGHSEVTLTANSLGMVLDMQNKTEEAEALFRETLKTVTEHLGPEHPQALSVMNNLAQLLRGAKRFDEAEKLYREALAIRKRVSGDDNVDTLTLVVNLGIFMRDTGKHDQALLQFQHAREGLARVVGPEHWMTQATIGFMGDELLSLDRIDEAERALLDAHAGLTKALGERHDRTRLVAMALTSLYEKKGSEADAAKWRSKSDVAEPEKGE